MRQPRWWTVDVVCEEIGPRIWQVRCGQCPAPGIIGVSYQGPDEAMSIADIHCFGHAVKRGETVIRSQRDKARWVMFQAQCRKNRARAKRLAQGVNGDRP